MFARLARDQVRNLGGLDYGDAWSLVSADSEPVSLFLVHIPCTWADASSQQYYANRQSDKICAVELAEGHDRSIVVGDFNMNPFDASMVNGFNATMSEPMARKGSRRIGAVERKFFFNPMWSLIGQRTDGPPGTFYFNKSLPLTYYWHALDQVLVRPSLLDALDQKSVQIVSRIRRRDLLTRGGLPDKRQASDHLPIVFRLHLNGETNGAETVRSNSMA